MPPLCLSLVENLRCLGLKRQESAGILVPPIATVLVSLWVIYARWNRGRSHWLLVAEGWTFLSLAIVDFFVHTDRHATTTLSDFKSIDLFLGALSFVPLASYLTYIYFYSQSKLFTGMADRPKAYFVFAMIAIIPFLVFWDEIGSFFGIEYGMSISAKTGLPALVVGFKSNTEKRIWTGFASIGLAFMIIVQGVTFLLTVIKLNPSARRKAAEFLYDDPDDFPSGLLQSSIGFFLGMVESAVGFSFGGFKGVMARRIFKFVSRSFLVWGASSDTRAFRIPIITFEIPALPRFRFRRMRKKDIRPLIGKPRDSTFVVLTPRAIAFYNLPRASAASPEPALSINTQIRGQAFALGPEQKGVAFQNNPPQLDLRFSELNLEIPRRPGQRELSMLSLSAVMEEGMEDPFEEPQETYQQAAAANSRSRGPVIQRPPAARVTSGSSGLSGQSDTLSAVMELASQFPGLPNRAAPNRQAVESYQTDESASVIAFDDSRRAVIKPIRTTKRKPPPPSSYSGMRRVSNAKPPYLSVNTELSTKARKDAIANTIPYQPYEEPDSSATRSGSDMNRYPLRQNTTGSTLSSAPIVTPVMSPSDSIPSSLPERPVGRLAARLIGQQGNRKEMARWASEDPNVLESAYAGSVNVRIVPSPTPGQTVRDSVTIEPALGQFGAVYEAATGVVPSKPPFLRPARYDSGIFGEDDRGFVRFLAGEAL